MNLNGRTAVVTGGSRGIGAATALALAAAGAGVLISARSRQEIEATLAELRGLPGRVAGHPCDVTDPESVRELVQHAHDTLGQIDVLVNNAGVSGSAPLHRMTLDDWNQMFAVNATGTFLCTQAFVPEMLARRWGRVVNIASIAGLEGSKYIAAYAASKHAVLGFTGSVAKELTGTGVTINAICPGYVDTPMTGGSVENVARKTGLDRAASLRVILESAGQERLLTKEEVAHAVVSLCGVDAAEINGQAIVFESDGTAHPRA